MPNAPSILSQCPACRKNLRIPADWIGKSVRCKHCSQTIKLNGKSATSGQLAPESAAIPAAKKSYLTSKKRSSNLGVWILSAVLLIATAVIGILVVKPELLTSAKGKGDVAASGSEPSKGSESGKGGADGGSKGNGASSSSDFPVATGIFPRRLLIISISNYIYANPLLTGEGTIRQETDRRDLGYIANKLSEKWKIPKDQIYTLSDAPGPNAKPSALPLKNVITKTLDLFLESSRAQDRIMVVFCGHAVEKDGAVFLAPLEADLEEPTTMIPLAEVYDKLKRCKAQEKVAVFDVCRKNSKLGDERTTSAAMTEAMEKEFHKAPLGTSVWTSCSKGEYSYELNSEYYGSDTHQTFVNGSIFLNLFVLADFAGQLAVRETTKPNDKTGGIQTPADPLPLSALVKFVKEQAGIAAKNMEDAPQTPKFTKASHTSAVAYNPAEAQPPHFVLPKSKETASAKDVSAIFAELSLPPLKEGKSSAKNFDGIIPFDQTVLKPYLPDNVTAADAENKSKYPIRAAVLEASKQIRELSTTQKKALPTELRESVNDNLKKRFTELQRPLADAEALFKDLHKLFTKLKDKKSEEPSKRWQANFDYMFAQIDLRLAYFGEYNKALSQVKTDNLDTAAAKKGFILGSEEKMSAAKEIRDFAEEGKAILDQMSKDYAGTPWGVLARRERNTKLGLKWNPIRVSGEEEKK